MKNLLKFGFMGLALSLAVASCGSSDSDGEEAADSLELVPAPPVDTAVVDTLPVDTLPTDTF